MKAFVLYHCEIGKIEHWFYSIASSITKSLTFVRGKDVEKKKSKVTVI